MGILCPGSQLVFGLFLCSARTTGGDQVEDQIRVTCRAAATLPLDSLVELQGNAKRISEENLEKLKRSILCHGFTAPIFIWNSNDNHVLDGHQRLKALAALRDDGYEIPGLPVAYIDADSERHARQKLLYITSQYGEFDRQGLDVFLTESGLSLDDVEGIRLADGELILTPGGFDVDSFFTDEERKSGTEEPKTMVCPHCGEEITL